MKNLVQTVIDAGNFKTLVKALQEACLVDILRDRGPFTIFAPTDQAFTKLPKGTIEELLNNKEKLTEILTYHIIQNKVMVCQIVNIKKANTVNGKNISINTKNGIKVDKAKIIKTDMECINGVIHVIDQVLIPS